MCVCVREIRNEILLNHKREQNNAICSNMDGPRDYYTEEVNQGKTDRYHMYCLFVDFKIEASNEFIYKTEIELQMQKTNLKSLGGDGGGVNWKTGIETYTLYV